MNQQRKPLIFFLAGLVLVVIGAVVWSLTSNSQTPISGGTEVTFKVADGVTASVYAPYEEEGSGVHESTTQIPPEENLLFTIQGEETRRLDIGGYVVAMAATDKYEKYWDMIEVGPEKRTVTVNPSLTTQELQASGTNERQAIIDAISKAYPHLTDLYTIEQGKFYEQGQWYGTKLTYKGQATTNTDPLRIVLHKEDGAWKLVTTPPSILVSTKLHPSIPVAVARDVNFNQ